MGQLLVTLSHFLCDFIIPLLLLASVFLPVFTLSPLDVFSGLMASMSGPWSQGMPLIWLPFWVLRISQHPRQVCFHRAPS